MVIIIRNQKWMVGGWEEGTEGKRGNDVGNTRRIDSDEWCDHKQGLLVQMLKATLFTFLMTWTWIVASQE